jgi:hypothetical protein
MVFERKQRKTFASELHNPAQTVLKQAEWCTRWDHLYRGAQHPTPFEQARSLAAARAFTASSPYRTGASMGMRVSRPMATGPMQKPARLSVGSQIDCSADRTIDFPINSGDLPPAISTPMRSTQNQLAHTGYLFGDISTLSSATSPIGNIPSRFSFERSPARLPKLGSPPAVPPSSPVRSAYAKDQIGCRFSDSLVETAGFNMMSEGRASTPSKSKTTLTLSSHRHMGFERGMRSARQIGGGVPVDQVATWARVNQFNARPAKQWPWENTVGVDNDRRGTF